MDYRSVRVPAHFSGIYSLRCSTGRWPKNGTVTSMPGQEGIPSVFSPMSRTLGDLSYFTKSLISMKPWKYGKIILILIFYIIFRELGACELSQELSIPFVLL
jgi:hypothetical protein